ncbi:MAG TPA: sulfide/dihydroorotate dehydrogenase-like FAD/NAD-binding protein [Candidatus Izemoplasmatales bacterium]|nr:sulfide/dihydroorotate dehydrogenase-like FAD/NAD-binding protein [Candidatus Izemoplasmatales bacterium]
MYRILKKRKINKDVDLMVIEAPMVSKNTKPGHFVIVRTNENSERIPLTIVEHDKKTITIIYQKIGFSTKELGNRKIGEFLEDVVGPLGTAKDISYHPHIIGIAGGVGAAPLYPQLKAYAEIGCSVDLIIGAKSKEYLILIDEYKTFCRNIYVATDDGSMGTKGFVTDVMKKVYASHKYDLSIAIGPLIMMKNAVLLNNKHQIKTDVSLNPIMIDGTGMCGNCRVSIHGKTYFACVDGPDFPADGIDFDELMHRQSYYKDEEHQCRIKLGNDHE